MNALRWDIERAIRDSGLPYPARLLVLSLLTRADAETATVPLVHSPSLARLAADTGLDRATVKRHLVIVEKAGWVTRHRSARAAEEQAPNWYEIHLPSGRRASLGAERAQGAGRRANPGLGAESRKAGRTARPNQNKTYTRPPSGAPAPARDAVARGGTFSPPGAAPTAQAILAAFIDWDRDRGGQLTRRTIGQLAREIGTLLGEGIDAGRIRQGLAAWRSRGQHPSTLHSFIDAATAAPRPPRPPGRRNGSGIDWDAALARARERDAAEARGELPPRGELP